MKSKMKLFVGFALLLIASNVSGSVISKRNNEEEARNSEDHAVDKRLATMQQAQAQHVFAQHAHVQVQSQSHSKSSSYRFSSQ
ncbi:unnamed protein product [Clavelina lepadiformis]|uniref:Uncharacterized protein n=1 Tax=Clavelina lepadiformis TaxID=159417 RepID=A0ABP0FAQ5_CLALP